MKRIVLSKLPSTLPWRHTLHWYDSTDSTNLRARQLAKDGAPHGTVLIAQQQTAGRGRMGRTFQSEPGGAYLSVILRPCCSPAQLMHLTCAVAVAMTEAIENTCGIRSDIKWVNDLVWQRKKLGGILTELALDSKTGLVDYAIVGVGINCTQRPEDFPESLREIATSLSVAADRPIAPAALLPEMVMALYRLDGRLLSEKEALMQTYRSRCITLGASVSILRGGQSTPAQALGIDGDGGLLVRYGDGSEAVISSGEASVRGFYGST